MLLTVHQKIVRLLLLCNWMDYFFIVFNLYIVFVIVHFLKSIFTFVYHSASCMECIQNQELSFGQSKLTFVRIWRDIHDLYIEYKKKVTVGLFLIGFSTIDPIHACT